MIENKLTQTLKEAGIEFRVITIPKTSEDKKREKIIQRYITEMEYAHYKAKNNKIVYKFF